MVGVLTIASFMEVLDAGVANVALPVIAGNLSITSEDASLVTSVYLVSNAVIVPLTGWMSSLFGRKRLYLTCVAIFIAASFLCGMSTSLEALVLFRIVQGLGGGSLVALEQAFIVDSVPAEKRGMAFSIYGATLACSPILAPALGGWITDNYGWQWIFFINIPIGLLSLFLVSTLLTETNAVVEERKRVRESASFQVDWVGIVLITVGIGALMIVLDKGSQNDWFESEFIIASSMIALFTLVMAFAWEWTRKYPAVDLRLLLNRGVAGGAIVIFVLAMVNYGNLVLVPLFAQQMFGFTAQDSGTINIVSGIVSIVTVPVAGYMLKLIDARWLAIAGLTMTAFVGWQMTALNLNAGYWDLAFIRACGALAGAFLGAPVITAAFRGVPKDKTDNASSLITTSACLGGSFGIAILTTYLSNRTGYRTGVLSSQASNYNPNYVEWLNNVERVLQDKGMTKIESAEFAPSVVWSEIHRQASMLAFTDAFYILTAMTVCAIPFVFLFKSTGSGIASENVDFRSGNDG